MSHVAPLPSDPRRPDLAAAALRAVAVATHIQSVTGTSEVEVLNGISSAMYATESGEHRQVTLAGAAGFGVSASDLAAAYDADLPARRPGSANQVAAFIGRDALPVESLVAAVVRLESCKHIKLIYMFANRCAARYGKSPEELFFHGFMGLTNALASYNPANGTVSTFAQYRISGSIRDGIRSENPVPKRLTTFIRAVESAEEKLAHELSRVPTKSEVAELLGEQARYLPLWGRLGVQASLDEPGAAEVSILEADASEEVIREELSRVLQAEMSSLPRANRVAVQALLLEERPVREVAAEEGCTQREVRERANVGLQLLRERPNLQEWATASA